MRAHFAGLRAQFHRFKADSGRLRAHYTNLRAQSKMRAHFAGLRAQFHRFRADSGRLRAHYTNLRAQSKMRAQPQTHVYQTPNKNQHPIAICQSDADFPNYFSYFPITSTAFSVIDVSMAFSKSTSPRIAPFAL